MIKNNVDLLLILTVSKIHEKCIKSSIMSFLGKHTYFSSNKFGFLSNMSTINPLTKTSNFIYSNKIESSMDFSGCQTV